MRIIVCVVWSTVISVLGLSCDLGPNLDSPNHGTYFRVEPHAITMAEGRDTTLTVKTDCEVTADVFKIHWHSSPPGMADVAYSGTGLEAHLGVYVPGVVYAVAQHAIFGERVDSAKVTVRMVTPRALAVSPDTIDLPVGEFSWAWATVYDSVGVVLSRPNWQWNWSIAVGGIVGFGQAQGNGIEVFGYQPGQTTIMVSTGAFSATALVRVH